MTGSPFVFNMATTNDTVEMIKRALKSNGEGRYTISPQDLSDLEVPLWERRAR